MSEFVFYLLGLLLLGIMAYVLWSGVGRRRPSLGRGFAIIVGGRVRLYRLADVRSFRLTATIGRAGTVHRLAGAFHLQRRRQR